MVPLSECCAKPKEEHNTATKNNNSFLINSRIICKLTEMTKTAERTTATPGGNDCLNFSILQRDDNQIPKETAYTKKSLAAHHY